MAKRLTATLLNRRSLVLGGFAVLGLSACSKPAPIRIAGHPWPGYETLFYAQSQGWLPPDVALQFTATQKESIDSLKAGTADAAMLTLDEALTLQVKGVALEIILVFDVSRGADALVVRPGIATLSQLRGRSIGVEPSALGELMLAMVLEKAGLKPRDVKPIRIPYDEQEAAFKKNQIDALISYEPVVGRLMGQGAQRLISTRELPDSVFDVLAVRIDVARARADTLRATLLGHFKALEQLRSNPWDTAYRMAPHAGISAEELVESFRGLELPDIVANRSYLSQKNGHLTNVSHKLSTILLQAGTIATAANPEALFTDAYLPSKL
jgi:NitT/TauT family transport system substrate-binding protein